MYFPLYELVFTVLTGLIASLLAQFIANFFSKRRSNKNEAIDDSVKRLTQSLVEATTLISDIESEIQARFSLATQLQSDIEQYNKLVELNKPEVEAIAQLLRGELRKEGQASFWKGFAVNFLFFTLGAVASLIISLSTK